MRRLSPLGVRIFLFSALAITLALGAALLLIRGGAARAADLAIDRALAATKSAVEDNLAARSDQLLATAAGLAGVSSYASRVEEGLRSDDHGTLLDAADEFRRQLGAAWTLLTDRAGLLAAWSDHPERAGNDLSGGSLIGLALQGARTQGVWIEPTDDGERLFQAVGVPLRAPGASAPFGVLVAALPVDSALAERLHRNTNSEVLFFIRDTAGVATPNVSTLPGAMDLAGAVGRDTAVARVALAKDDDVWVGSLAHLRTASGAPIAGVVGLRSRGGELAPYVRLERVIWFSFAAGLLLTLATSAWIAKRITTPVAALVGATRRVRAGDYSGRVAIDSPDEIGELSRAFQHMVDELGEQRRLVEFLSAGAAAPAAGERPPAAGVPALEPGTVLAGRYQLEEMLGSGGMGVVYRARDRELGETVAVKLLRPELSQAGLLDRFKQEIRLARRITHRNVVRTHDIGEEQGIYFITMEYVEGTPVDQLIRRRGRLPADVTLTIGKQLCRALVVAHEAGVIHRDIKPGNLVLDGAGFLKVMDFGIARLAERPAGADQGLTQAGTVVGSPDYMAPEQLLGEDLDQRVDVYATGCVLFECLTGRLVHEAPNVYALISQHLKGPAPDPRAHEPGIPEPLAAIVRRAVARDRNDRWPGAGALLDALEALA